MTAIVAVDIVLVHAISIVACPVLNEVGQYLLASHFSKVKIFLISSIFKGRHVVYFRFLNTEQLIIQMEINSVHALHTNVNQATFSKVENIDIVKEIDCGDQQIWHPTARKKVKLIELFSHVNMRMICLIQKHLVWSLSVIKLLTWLDTHRCYFIGKNMFNVLKSKLNCQREISRGVVVYQSRLVC